MEKEEILIEKLAELEHDIWWEWSKELSETETISPKRLARWDKTWTFYRFLTEKQKEQDRFYARKIISILKELGIKIESSTGGKG